MATVRMSKDTSGTWIVRHRTQGGTATYYNLTKSAATAMCRRLRAGLSETVDDWEVKTQTNEETDAGGEEE
jgi:hypothetical protein